MRNRKKVIDPIPESFATETEAGEFWDTHSLADYAEFLEPVEMTFEISKRHYEVKISQDVFEGLRKEAESTHQSVSSAVDRILRKQLSLAK